MSADLARARGNNRRVLSDLHMAQNLRRQQVGVDPPPGFAPEAGAQAAGVSGQNPFRSNGSRNAAPPLRLADASGLLPSSSAGPAIPTDTMSADIDHDIAAAQSQLATTFRVGPEFRSRSGSPGLDQLNEITMPLEMAFSPGGLGRMTLKATPTLLSSGTLMGGLANQQQFGSLVFGGTAPDSQHAQGLGLSVSYNYRAFSGDIGTSPLGFRVQNLLGGLEVAPEIAEGLRLRLVGEQRAVTDSLLSYAGTTDPRTGEVFGGVIRDRGHAQLEMSSGLANFYGGGGYSTLSGHNVAPNNELEFGAGGSYPIYRTPTDEVRVGLDLVYFAYDKNLRYFTLGQGGYFSPQSYFAAVIPVDYTARQDNLTWSVGASVGVQSYTENSSAVFPTNAGLQAQLVSLADSNTSTTPIVTSYPGKSQSGIVGGVRGGIEYQLGPDLHVGGRLRYDKAGDWNETQATVFVRYVLNGMK
jgi:cellulose synthase operon protein C